MSKRTDYSKESKKAKKPSSIRCNVQDLEAAMEISGRKTVQSLVDYLLAKFLAEHGRHLVAPIDAIDRRPIDQRIFDVSKERDGIGDLKGAIRLGMIQPEKQNIEDINWQKVTPKSYDGIAQRKVELDEMPMWTPKPKAEKVATKAETEKFAAAEMKRLKEMQERQARIKNKK